MSPHRAHLHTADALPGLLAFINLLLLDYYFAVFIGKAHHRRRLAVNLYAVIAEYPEGDSNDCYQRPPILLVFTHTFLLCDVKIRAIVYPKREFNRMICVNKRIKSVLKILLILKMYNYENIFWEILCLKSRLFINFA